MTRKFPALSRGTKDRLTPLPAKGTTSDEVASVLGVDPATAARHLDDAEYDGLAAQRDGQWTITPLTVTHQVGSLTATGQLHWRRNDNSSVTPHVTFDMAGGESGWKGHVDLQPTEADALARLIASIVNPGNKDRSMGLPGLIGFLTHSAMSVESYDRGRPPTLTGPGAGEGLDEKYVYIAEAIWHEENPIDGRARVAVCRSLEDALGVLRGHGIYGGDLAATEVTDSAVGTADARTWAVHERTEKPDDEGCLWITEEKITGGN